MNDYDVRLTRKDGSVRNFHLYGQSTPHSGDIITLPVDGEVVKARIGEPAREREIAQSDRADALEI